jgi:hypothetical protein
LPIRRRVIWSAWRISQGSSVGFIEEGSRINAALQMSELRYVKLRPATHRIWLSDLKKGWEAKTVKRVPVSGWLDL